MKRLLMILTTVSFMFAQMSPVGAWKLTGLQVDYFDIARETVAVEACDSYPYLMNPATGGDICIDLKEIIPGALFNKTQNGPFTDGILQAAGINLNVNLYPDNTGAIGEGSYYPDVDIGTNPDGSLDCITSGKIFPITDIFNWSAPGNQNDFPALSMPGLPSANNAAGTYAEGLGVTNSSVFDNWTAYNQPVPIPAVVPFIADVSYGHHMCFAHYDATLGYDQSATYEGCRDQYWAANPNGILAIQCDALCAGGLADQSFGGDLAACVGAATADPATFGCGYTQGTWGGQYSTDTRPSQMGNVDANGDPTNVDFLLEWNAIDGTESESGLGDDIGVDEDGDGTDFDRIFGVPYVSSTYLNTANPLCDISGGLAVGNTFNAPVAGDIVNELGGKAAVGALITGICKEKVNAGALAGCTAAGSPFDFVFAGCLAGVEAAAAAGCQSVDTGVGDGVFNTVFDGCVAQANSTAFADGCAYYGVYASVLQACVDAGGPVVSDPNVAGGLTCADLALAYEQASGGDVSTGGTLGGDCSIAIAYATSTDPASLCSLAGGIGAATYADCDAFAAGLSDAFLDSAAQAGDLTGDGNVDGLTCTQFAGGATAGFGAGATMVEYCGAFADAVEDSGFESQNPFGWSCTDYGDNYVDTCVEDVSGALSFYVLDLSLEQWGLFLTFNASSYAGAAASVAAGIQADAAAMGAYQAACAAVDPDPAAIADCVTAEVTAATALAVCTASPAICVNDADHDFDQDCLLDQDPSDCSGRLIMDFAPTCVAEVEAHQIVAEFNDLANIDCSGVVPGDVTGGWDDIACVGCDCVDTNANGQLDVEELCWNGCADCDGMGANSCPGFDPSPTGDSGLDCYEGGAGNGTVNVADIVKVINHILGTSPLGGYLFCAGDVNTSGSSAGIINIMDVIAIVNITLGNRVGDATEAVIDYSDNHISIDANGFIGGLDITVEFADNSFIFELGENMVADYLVDNNTARIIMVGGEQSIEDVINVTQGTITDIIDITVTSSTEEITNVTFDQFIPQDYVIKTAYPNPFNPVTTIGVELNTQADISVKVYNLTGQLVDVIAKGSYEIGSYDWTWNADGLASGVYFITTQIGNDMNNQKVMLIK